MNGWEPRRSAAARLAVGAMIGAALVAGAVGVARATNPATPPAAATAPQPADVLRAQLRRERARDAQVVRHLRRDIRALRRVLAHAPSVQEALTLAAVTHGVPRNQLATVAFCESRLNPAARNGRYRGLFQQGPMFEATPYGRAGLSPWSPYAAALSTAMVVAHQGWRQWECKP